MSGTLQLGLTGGIGSGKSTVAGMLADLGAVVVDADAISRSLTAPGGSAIPVIAAQFGGSFIAADGALDRQRMRERIYSDPPARQQLEAIIHPLVGQLTQQQAAQAIAEERPCVVFDIPLLVESGHWRTRLHRVVVVDCDEATQISRVMARNNLPCAEVEKIIAAQASRAQRLAAADSVIYNQLLSLSSLKEEVAQLARRFGL